MVDKPVARLSPLSERFGRFKRKRREEGKAIVQERKERRQTARLEGIIKGAKQKAKIERLKRKAFKARFGGLGHNLAKAENKLFKSAGRGIIKALTKKHKVKHRTNRRGQVVINIVGGRGQRAAPKRRRRKRRSSVGEFGF